MRTVRQLARCALPLGLIAVGILTLIGCIIPLAPKSTDPDHLFDPKQIKSLAAGTHTREDVTRFFGSPTHSALDASVYTYQWNVKDGYMFAGCNAPDEDLYS